MILCSQHLKRKRKDGLLAWQQGGKSPAIGKVVHMLLAPCLSCRYETSIPGPSIVPKLIVERSLAYILQSHKRALDSALECAQIAWSDGFLNTIVSLEWVAIPRALNISRRELLFEVATTFNPLLSTPHRYSILHLMRSRLLLVHLTYLVFVMIRTGTPLS